MVRLPKPLRGLLSHPSQSAPANPGKAPQITPIAAPSVPRSALLIAVAVLVAAYFTIDRPAAFSPLPDAGQKNQIQSNAYYSFGNNKEVVYRD